MTKVTLMYNHYEEQILRTFISKYHINKQKQNEGKVTRSISIKPTALYSKYDKQSGDFQEVALINKTVNELESKGFVTGVKKKYSDDLEKIILKEDRIDQVLEYAKTNYDLDLPDEELEKEKKILEQYQGKGILTDYYLDTEVIRRIDKHAGNYYPRDDEQFLKLLDFVQNNKEELYVREVSMKVFGTSKVLETQYLSRLCNLISSINQQEIGEEYNSEEILKDYHIHNVDREILIRGNIIINFNSHSLDISDYSDGISIMSSDISRIKSVEVKDSTFITIENKTPFFRFNMPDYSVMYLGGFASRYQIQFLKKIYSNNKGIKYYHFGDIDVGGFRIYQNIIEESRVPFQLFHMSVEELKKAEYRESLCELTETDRTNATVMVNNLIYGETIQYMLSNNVKLEQEIVAYYLVKYHK